MRHFVILLMFAAVSACEQPGIVETRPIVTATAASVTFDGGDYADEVGKLAHGKRLDTLFGCNACHGPDHSGVNFGEMIPIVDGLWASNISREMPKLSDAQLERLLRDGIHPSREIYVMPSKQTQFLSARDMDALIAHLRTIPPTGEPTPLPPKDFEAAVTARLPDDYWRTQLEGEKRGYHNAQEEVAYFAAHRLPDLGPHLARGRVIASSLCSTCHGAELNGIGEPAGNIQGALAYDDAAFNRLLTESVDRTGKQVKVEWGFGHEAQPLTSAERRDVIAYVRALARIRAN